MQDVKENGHEHTMQIKKKNLRPTLKLLSNSKNLRKFNIDSIGTQAIC